MLYYPLLDQLVGFAQFAGGIGGSAIIVKLPFQRKIKSYVMTATPRSFLYDAVLEKIGDENPWGINFGITKEGCFVKEIKSSIKLLKISESDISIQPFDILVAINKIDVIGSEYNEVITRLKNAESPVLLRFRRKSNKSSKVEHEQPDFCLHLTGLNGEALELTVTSTENKRAVISRFVHYHGLPEQLIPVLLEKLKVSSSEHEQGTDPSRTADNASLDDGTYDEVETPISRAEMSFHSLKSAKGGKSPLRPIKRSLSFSSLPSMKPSSSPRKLKNQDFFNDMHEEAARSRERKNLLREIEWKNREAEVLSTSFRGYSSLKLRDDEEITNSFRDLYKDQKHWLERRKQRIEEMRSEKKNKQDEAFEKDYPFKPVLETSFAKQVKRSYQNLDQFYDALYSWQKYYQKRAVERKEFDDLKFRANSPFIPKVNRATSSERKRKTEQRFVNTEAIQIENSVLDSKSFSQVESEHIFSPEYKLLRSRLSPLIQDVEVVKDEILPKTTERVELNLDAIEKLRSIPYTPQIEGKDQSYWRSVLSSYDVSHESKSISPAPVQLNENSVSDFNSELGTIRFVPEPANVYDRLYMGRREHSELMKRLSSKHHSSFSHTPDIGVNKSFRIEKNRSDFFERLHKHHELKRMEALKRTIQNEEAAEANKRSITADAATHLVERLLFKQAQVEEYRRSKKDSKTSAFQALSNSKFMSSSSNKFAEQKQRQALGEIFNVLLVTTFLKGNETTEKTEENSKVSPNQEIKQVKDVLGEVLQVGKADTSYLTPKDLSDAISVVLQSFTNDGRPLITKNEFVEKTLEMMFQGRFQPINHLLTPLNQYHTRLKNLNLDLSSEELTVRQHMRNKPSLKAERVTNKLTEYRYKDRKMHKVSIEDSLLSYIEISEQKRQQLRAEIDDDLRFHCTFKPCLFASYYQEELQERRKRSQSR